MAFCCHFEQPAGTFFKNEPIKICPWVVQTLRDKKYDINDTAEEISSMLQDKILWENAKLVAAKSQMITN